MSTCDTIDLLHGKSSNFLDAGGKATPETIKEAFRIVLKDEKVQFPSHSANYRSILSLSMFSEVVSILTIF